MSIKIGTRKFIGRAGGNTQIGSERWDGQWDEGQGDDGDVGHLHVMDDFESLQNVLQSEMQDLDTDLSIINENWREVEEGEVYEYLVTLYSWYYWALVEYVGQEGEEGRIEGDEEDEESEIYNSLMDSDVMQTPSVRGGVECPVISRGWRQIRHGHVDGDDVVIKAVRIGSKTRRTK